MNRFKHVLKETHGRLAVPEPARSRILLEIAADMEDLLQEFLERGLSPEAAEEQVLEHFDLSDDVLRELARVHDTPLQRSLQSLSEPVGGPWSRILLLVLAMAVVLGSGRFLFQTQLYRDASGLLWALMPLLGLGALLAAKRAYRLLRSRDSWSPGLRSGLGGILGLSLLTPALAVVGLWVELYRSIVQVRNAPGEALIHLVGWLHMASATLTVALSGSLILGLLWFLLDARARRQESLAAATLLGGSA